jgi:hypothetical protein
MTVHRPTHQSRRQKVGLERLQRIAGIKNSKKLTTVITALVLAATAVVAEPLPVA